MTAEQPMIAKWKYELLEKRIEALEAALQFYADPKNYTNRNHKGYMWDPARVALDPASDIGCGKSVIEPWGVEG